MRPDDAIDRDRDRDDRDDREREPAARHPVLLLGPEPLARYVRSARDVDASSMTKDVHAFLLELITPTPNTRAAVCSPWSGIDAAVDALFEMLPDVLRDAPREGTRRFVPAEEESCSAWGDEDSGAFMFTLVPIRPRSRGERRSLRTLSSGASLRPRSPAGFNPDTPRRLSTPLLTPFNSTPISSLVRNDPQRNGSARSSTTPSGERRGRRRGGCTAVAAAPTKNQNHARRSRRRRSATSLTPCTSCRGTTEQGRRSRRGGGGSWRPRRRRARARARARARERRDPDGGRCASRWWVLLIPRAIRGARTRRSLRRRIRRRGRWRRSPRLRPWRSARWTRERSPAAESGVRSRRDFR